MKMPNNSKANCWLSVDIEFAARLDHLRRLHQPGMLKAHAPRWHPAPARRGGQIRARCGHDRAGRQSAALGPVEPVLEQPPQSRQAARRGQGGKVGRFVVTPHRFIDGGDLQFFLGTEMREQTGFGKSGTLRKATNGQRLEPCTAAYRTA